MIVWSSFDSWVSNILIDTTNTGAGWLTDPNVSSITPWGSPWVSDYVVASGSWNTISDSNNCVVNVGSTSSAGNDSWGVWLEGGGVSFNSNWDWLLSNSSLNGQCVCSNVCLGTCVVFTWTSNVLTATGNSIARTVWVLGLSIKGRDFCVVPGIIVPSAITSLVSIRAGAGNQLLLREAWQGWEEDGVGAFHGGSGWESPARTALSLVFYGVHFTGGDPVDWGWNGEALWCIG